MDNHITYRFSDRQTADRFLNRLKAGAVSGVQVRRQHGGLCVLARYPLPLDATFDTTCQQLDDLAAGFGGHEDS
ncbi:MAG TPA: hypothetical protein VIC26_02160 [Marinagarivorans sp.]